MTIIDTTLYADGALRLSRHGAGRGDTILLFNDGVTTNQFTVPDAETADLQHEVEKWLAGGRNPAFVFDVLYQMFKPLPPPTRAAAPGWLHN